MPYTEETMSIFESLMNNKGTVSSALGKKYAEEVLQGNLGILKEAIKLVSFDARNIAIKQLRAGAAKTFEVAAEEKPELVAPDLEKLLPTLS
jgi:hypothetical protein